MCESLKRLTIALASPRLTVAWFLFFAAAALWVAQGGAEPTAWMALPFAVLFINVAAAIVVQRRFRADLPLLLFHLALLALVTLVVVGRATHFEGNLRLTSGAAFAGEWLRTDMGPLHGQTYMQLRFANDGFVEEYPSGGAFHYTRNAVRWWDDRGFPVQAEIGDDRALVLMGYRIFATRNRGYAALFRWQPKEGGSHEGSALLPLPDSQGFSSGIELDLPDGPQIWGQLQFPAPLPVPAAGARRSNLGAGEVDHRLVLRLGETRHELVSGSAIDLPGGRLTYVRLTSWMGYRVVYDPTVPWILATVAFGLVSLLWFYVRRWKA